MSFVFYFHTQNSIAKKLADLSNERGFIYQNRGHLDMKMQNLLAQAGYDMWPTCHSVIGSLAGSIDKHIPLNPDDPLDRHTLKVCKSGSPWCFYRIVNGPKMSQVLGWCSSAGTAPFAMGIVEQAQKGISSATYVPRAL